MTNISTKILIQDNPVVSEFDPADFGLPTQAELDKSYSRGVDNFSSFEADPINWLIFDPGNGDDASPTWVSKSLASGKLSEAGALQFVNPGAYLNTVSSFGSNAEFFATGGPRNKGFTNISDSTFLRMNHQLGYQDSYGSIIHLRNEVWKQGSIELTIKPEKENCTLLSGTIFGDVKDGLGGFNVPLFTNGAQIIQGTTEIGVDATAHTELIEYSYTNAVSENAPYSEAYITYTDPQTGIPYVYTDSSAGLVLGNIDHVVRTFKIDIVDGVLRISYEIYYGENKKYIEFYGNKNIVDGEWHSVIINRPTEFTLKDPETTYGGNGCIEIWIDGQLDKRSYEITSNDPLPTPNMLFNDYTNPGLLNYKSNGASWIKQELAKTNYVGGIRDFIFRQSTPLSPHYIGLNYVYSMLNVEGGRVMKPRAAKMTAKIVQPTVSVNKKSVLKLYWDTLLEDKTKFVDGLELDETFNVHSYSVTKNNIVSETQTFNLDLNDKAKTRTVLNDVRAAVGKHVFIPKPGIQIMSGVDATGKKYSIDYTNEKNVIAQYFGNDALFVNNLEYGGVMLNPGDRVLLFNQPRSDQNGIWIFNGPNSRMTRPTDVSPEDYKDATVYVTEGKYKGQTFVQINRITSLKLSAQKWIKTNSEISLTTPGLYPISTSPWTDENGVQRFIDVNTDVNFDYDIIVFMNYPTENKDIAASLVSNNDTETFEKYKEFIENIKTAVENGKSLFISSPQLAVDFGIVSSYVDVDQLFDESGDAQSAAISPFESDEPAEYYFNTHRNMKYSLAFEYPGLTDKETYLMSDIVVYSPDKTNSDYHIKYNYRQFGPQEGDEFIIPGLTTTPETLNSKLPGYTYNQKKIAPLSVFSDESIIFGTSITKFANLIYDGSTAINNPYDDYVSTIAGEYGDGKVFVNCVENAYAMSRSDYNTGRIQNVTAGENSETVQTAAWQYSTKRLNKKNLFDASEITNIIGQTTPTNGGGGAIMQAQSHCSNGMIRKNSDKDNLVYQSDLYADFTEEIFETTEIPVLSMTWLGLQWLAE